MTGTTDGLTESLHDTASSHRAAPAARARLAPWPYEPDVAQVVLLDHHMVPTIEAIGGWVAAARERNPQVRAIRTGAVFPQAAAAFRAAGFRPIDELTLLEASLTQTSARSSRRSRFDTQRMRTAHHDDVAALDRRAFGDPWGNDVDSLNEISGATPQHRARIVTVTDAHGTQRIGGFTLTGQAGAFGYLQRLAVDPDFRRAGIARRLVDDSLRWMRRRGAATAMVNTALDNDAALALYISCGFRPRTETLVILELAGDAVARVGSTVQSRRTFTGEV